MHRDMLFELYAEKIRDGKLENRKEQKSSERIAAAGEDIVR